MTFGLLKARKKTHKTGGEKSWEKSKKKGDVDNDNVRLIASQKESKLSGIEKEYAIPGRTNSYTHSSIEFQLSINFASVSERIS